MERCGKSVVIEETVDSVLQGDRSANLHRNVPVMQAGVRRRIGAAGSWVRVRKDDAKQHYYYEKMKRKSFHESSKVNDILFDFRRNLAVIMTRLGL